LQFFREANIISLTRIDLSIDPQDQTNDEENEIVLCSDFLEYLAQKRVLSLSHLSLSGHYISSEKIDAIAEILKRVNVREIDLSATSSGGEDRSLLLEAIAASETLQYCNIAGLQIHDVNFGALCRLMMSPPIEVLDIRSTRLGWCVNQGLVDSFLATISGDSFLQEGDVENHTINLLLSRLVIDKLTLEDREGNDLYAELAQAAEASRVQQELTEGIEGMQITQDR
jgi:hypothetical protein